MMRRPRAGLLPLYLKLYDETFPALRNDFEPFMASIEQGLAAEGIDVARVEICRVAAECDDAVRGLEELDVDIIATLHLAYSPSEEAAGALCRTRKPLLLLDTTMDRTFGRDVDPARIMYNHGIHGVQDLASVLRRARRQYEIVAGHPASSSVLRRAADMARAARAARLLRSARALRIGESFRGMGDFAVEEMALRRFGIEVDQIEPEALAPSVESVAEDEIAAEVESDRARFAAEIDEEVHRRSARLGLGLRKYLEAGGYTAFSANFSSFRASEGPLSTVPFLEASKAMERGVGYAGEGDVLTAALVGALVGAFGRATFTEAFCPDWEGGALFLSHMGEINPALAAEKPRLREKDFPWTGARNPAIVTCALAPGPATLVNLAPAPWTYPPFALLAAPVTILEDATNPAMLDSIRCWIRPPQPLERFLETYSRLGGTHHSALVLGDHVEAIEAFARMAELDFFNLDPRGR